MIRVAIAGATILISLYLCSFGRAVEPTGTVDAMRYYVNFVEDEEQYHFGDTLRIEGEGTGVNPMGFGQGLTVYLEASHLNSTFVSVGSSADDVYVAEGDSENVDDAHNYPVPTMGGDGEYFGYINLDYLDNEFNMVSLDDDFILHANID